MEPSHEDDHPIPLMPKPGSVPLGPPPPRPVLEAPHQPVRLAPAAMPARTPSMSTRTQDSVLIPPAPKPASMTPAAPAAPATFAMQRPVPAPAPVPTPAPMPAISRPLVAPSVFESKPARMQAPKRGMSAGTFIMITLIALGIIVAALYVWGAQIDRARDAEEAALEE